MCHPESVAVQRIRRRLLLRWNPGDGGRHRYLGGEVWDLGLNGDAEWANLPSFSSPNLPSSPALAFTSGGRTLVASTPDGKALTVWDVRARRRLMTIDPAAIGFITAVRVSPHGRAIAAGAA
jgi:hypothetical protein